MPRVRDAGERIEEAWARALCLGGVQRADFMYAVREGAPITLKGTLLPDRGSNHPKFAWLLTLTVGCRRSPGSAQSRTAPRS